MSTLHEEAVAAAEQLQASVDAAINRIRENESLSIEGKQQAMARIVVAGRIKMSQLRGNGQSDNATAVKDAYRAVFGQPTDAVESMSYRDAVRRAGDIAAGLDSDDTGAEAMAQMRTEMTRALSRGDALMAKALASVAWDAHANSDGRFDIVVDLYADSDPAIHAQLEKLVAAFQNRGSGSAFGSGWAFLLQEPPEIAGRDLDGLIAQADAAAAAHQLDDVFSRPEPTLTVPGRAQPNRLIPAGQQPGTAHYGLFGD